MRTSWNISTSSVIGDRCAVRSFRDEGTFQQFSDVARDMTMLLLPVGLLPVAQRRDCHLFLVEIE
jgi:hypothetical protein